MASCAGALEPLGLLASRAAPLRAPLLLPSNLAAPPRPARRLPPAGGLHHLLRLLPAGQRLPRLHRHPGAGGCVPQAAAEERLPSRHLHRRVSAAPAAAAASQHSASSRSVPALTAACLCCFFVVVIDGVAARGNASSALSPALTRRTRWTRCTATRPSGRACPSCPPPAPASSPPTAPSPRCGHNAGCCRLAVAAAWGVGAWVVAHLACGWPQPVPTRGALFQLGSVWDKPGPFPIRTSFHINLCPTHPPTSPSHPLTHHPPPPPRSTTTTSGSRRRAWCPPPTSEARTAAQRRAAQRLRAAQERWQAAHARARSPNA